MVRTYYSCYFGTYRIRGKRLKEYFKWLFDESLQEYLKMAVKEGLKISKKYQAPYLSKRSEKLIHIYSIVSNLWHYKSLGKQGSMKASLIYTDILSLLKMMKIKYNKLDIQLLQVIETIMIDKEYEILEDSLKD